MPSTTALAYQMMIEEKLMSAAINAEQRGNFYVASQYLLTHAKFIGIDKLPETPMGAKTVEDRQEQYAKYYFNLLGSVSAAASQTLKEVREKYNKKTKDLPSVID